VTRTRDLQAAILKGNDLQGTQSSDAGTEGAHLPQETKVAVPQMQSVQDAGAITDPALNAWFDDHTGDEIGELATEA
jgi:hypothetical protein